MTNKKATLDDVNNLVGRRVLIRVDFNVPTDDKGRITDDNRIRQSLETIKYCISRGAKVILLSHFGRPDGVRNKKYSLEPAAVRLRQLLPRTTVYFVDDCVGEVAENQSLILKNGDVLLLENTRFYKEEEQNDPAFAKQLSELGDIFVDDAFGAVHRAHASTVGVAKYLPAVAGFLIEKELRFLSAVSDNPVRPLTLICGGKKVEDKLPVIEHLIGIADNVLVGGKIAESWTLKSPDVNIIVAKDIGFDITEETVRKFTEVIEKSGTIFWNGPMGMFENPRFAKGTKAIAAAVSKSKAISIVGGGDTAAAVAGYEFHHVSTGGGASLEFLEGKTLPGISCLLSAEELDKIERERGL